MMLALSEYFLAGFIGLPRTGDPNGFHDAGWQVFQQICLLRPDRRFGYVDCFIHVQL